MTPTVKPILFTGEMVRAILDGRKTQTRRVLKSPFPKQHPKPVNLAVHGEGDRGYSGEFNDPDSWGYPYAEDGCDMPLSGWPELNPYGNIGDYLWVRESFCVKSALTGADCWTGEEWIYEEGAARIYYPANKCSKVVPLLNVFQYVQAERSSKKKSVPSIHMPRWASRITLQIQDIRAQRVQDISEEDALTLPDNGTDFLSDGAVETCEADPCRAEFKRLWDSINWDRGYPWDFNPWVWAITFKPILKNIDDILAERPAA